MSDLPVGLDQSKRFTANDHAANALQALLKGVPYIGSTLEQFIFGPRSELRLRRIEHTLTEVAEVLRSRSSEVAVATEEYVDLLEDIAPHLARATNEDVRRRFRDLLTNAATIPPGNADWEDANLARTMLEEVSAPGLAIIAAVGRSKEGKTSASAHESPLISIVSLPICQVVIGDFDWQSPAPAGIPLHYDWAVVQEWVYRLREKRILGYGSVHAKGGFERIYLTPLGLLLIRWTISDDVPKSRSD